ncbi:MAG TPA: MFS transporter [Pseudonocardiaceae bacterium]|nr:MFS transporter [Pseudonocardiaceae bacterium]
MSAETQQNRSAGIWRTFVESPLAVKAVLGGVFVNRLGGFLNIFLVLFLTSKHYTDSQATVSLGLYGIGAVIGVLVGGALADRLGARNSTALSLAGSAVLIASILYLPDYPLVLIVVTVVGAVSQIWRPASATLLSTLISDDRQVMVFALYRFGLNLGTTAAPLIGYGLYYLGGRQYTLLFYGEALVAILYALIALWALPGKTKTSPAATSSTAEVRESYLAVLRDRRFTLYLFAMLINAIVYMQYLSTLPLDVKAMSLPVIWYTLAVALNGFIVIAFELLVTKVSQKWPFKVTAGIAFLLNAVGFAVYGLPLGPALILTGTLIWTLGEIIGGPTAFAYPGIAAPAHLKSRYIGAFQFMFGLGSALGPIIGGALFVAVGHAVWPVMGLLGAVGCVLGVTAITRSSPAAEPTPSAPAEVA